jgi:hypothetical protein
MVEWYKGKEMTTQEKGKYVADIVDILMKADVKDPASAFTAVPAFLMEMGEVLERIWKAGRDIGFKDGYAEGKKNNEIRISKMN